MAKSKLGLITGKGFVKKVPEAVKADSATSATNATYATSAGSASSSTSSTNSTNVTTKINNKNITDIFESDGTTAKKASITASLTPSKSSFYFNLQATTMTTISYSQRNNMHNKIYLCKVKIDDGSTVDFNNTVKTFICWFDKNKANNFITYNLDDSNDICTAHIYERLISSGSGGAYLVMNLFNDSGQEVGSQYNVSGKLYFIEIGTCSDSSSSSGGSSGGGSNAPSESV